MKAIRFSPIWMAVATLLVAGGLVLAIIGAGTAGLGRDIVGYGAMGVGAMLGGLSASRLSPKVRVPEIVFGAAALVVIFYFALRFGSDAWNTDALLAGCARVGLACTLGSFVGALLGKQIQRQRSEAAASVLWLSFLFTAGVLFLCIAASTVVGTRLDHLGQGTILVALILSAAIGGAVCQAVILSRRVVLCGSGGLISIIVVVASVAIEDVGDPVVLLAGGAPLGLICWLFGIQGARLAWRSKS